MTYLESLFPNSSNDTNFISLGANPELSSCGSKWKKTIQAISADSGAEMLLANRFWIFK
jgi:hypothetical protein